MNRIQLSDQWGEFFRDQPETGMSYHIVSVFLRGGRCFEQAVVVGGILSSVRGYEEIPFTEADIDRFVVTHDKRK